MFKGLLIFVFIVVFFSWVEFRYVLLHFPLVAYNAVVDSYKYIKYKRWREYKDFGTMNHFIASDKPFGSGKTLSLVDWLSSVYNTYNGLEVWNPDTKQWVTQHIKILSNITLYNIPYVPLTSEQQIINLKEIENSMDVYLVVLDEIGAEYNKRAWKVNLNSDMLDTILQQRKSRVAIIGTVQRFGHFDTLLRDLSTMVVACNKTWRIITQKYYYACDVERVQGNLSMLQPNYVRCRFSTDSLYNSYDTKERVSKLLKSIEDGEHVSNEEILLSSGREALSMDTLTRIRGKFKKRVSK